MSENGGSFYFVHFVGFDAAQRARRCFGRMLRFGVRVIQQDKAQNGGCRTARNAETKGANARAFGSLGGEIEIARSAGREASVERNRPKSRDLLP